MTDQELKDLVASLAIESAKNEAKWGILHQQLQLNKIIV